MWKIKHESITYVPNVFHAFTMDCPDLFVIMFTIGGTPSFRLCIKHGNAVGPPFGSMGFPPTGIRLHLVWGFPQSQRLPDGT